jgi:hypothetical protein
MAEAQVKSAKGKRAYPSKMKRVRENDADDEGIFTKKKQKSEKKKLTEKPQNVMLQLTNDVSLRPGGRYLSRFIMMVIKRSIFPQAFGGFSIYPQRRFHYY